MKTAYIFYCDGAGGGGFITNWSRGVCDGMIRAGYSGMGEVFRWHTGLGVAADQASSVRYKRGKAQIDLIPENMAALRRVAKKNGWRLSKAKKGFLIQGRDDLGAVQRHINRLAESTINITAADAVAAGRNRYGMILCVKPKDFARASRVLRAK